MNKNQTIKNALHRAVISQVPDVYDRVAHQPVQKSIEPFVAVAAKPRPRPVWSMATAFISLSIFLFGAWFMLLRVDSTIDLDVNPSIEIQINRLERVISLQPMNTDAIPIVSGIGYRNLRLDQVVNALMGSMYSHGYLESPESAILITVDNKNSQRAAELELSLTIEIDQITQLGSDKIFSQIIDSNPALAQMAEQIGVSRGKMQLILEAQLLHPQISIQEFSQMPIAELYRLAHSLENPDLPVEESTPAPIQPSLPQDPAQSRSGPKPGKVQEPVWTLPWDDDLDDDDDFDDDFDDDYDDD